MEREYGKEVVNQLRKDTWDKLNKQVEESFAMVAEKYADMKLRPNRAKAFADLARSELYEIQNLSVGKVAPEIEGEDVSGQNSNSVIIAERLWCLISGVNGEVPA